MNARRVRDFPDHCVFIEIDNDNFRGVRQIKTIRVGSIVKISQPPSPPIGISLKKR